MKKRMSQSEGRIQTKRKSYLNFLRARIAYKKSCADMNNSREDNLN